MNQSVRSCSRASRRGAVFINDRSVTNLGGIAAPLPDGDVIRVLPPIAGG